MKKTTNYLSPALRIAPAVAFLMATPLLAQEGRQVPVTNQPVPEKPIPDELVPRTLIKAPIGTKAIILNKDRVRLGVVRDHVIDSRAGKVLFMAVGAADKVDEPARLVPFSRFAWKADEQRFELPLTAEQLAALPKYDPENLSKAGAPVADDEGKPAERGGATGDTLEAAARVQESRLASTSILRSDVLVGRDRFATVGDLILEPNLGTIAFVLAADDTPDADPYIIPWRAMSWQAPVEEGTKGRFMLSLKQDALKDAPTLKGSDAAHLKDGKTVKRIYSFYKITPPVAADKTAGARG